MGSEDTDHRSFRNSDLSGGIAVLNSRDADEETMQNIQKILIVVKNRMTGRFRVTT